MSNQTILVGFESPEYQETSFLDSILSTLQSVIAARGGEPTHLFYKSTAAASGPSSGLSAYLYSIPSAYSWKTALHHASSCFF